MPAQYLDFYLSQGKVIGNKYFELQKAEVDAFYDILMSKKLGILLDNDWNKFLNNIDNNRASYIENFNSWIHRINAFKEDNRPIEGSENYEEKKDIMETKKTFLRTYDCVQYYWEEVTILILKTFLSERYELSLTEFSKCELFINVFNQYMIDVEIGACTPTINDFIDVFNMIYVTPVGKCWTSEKKWIGFIKDLGLTKYLFGPAVHE